MKQQQDNLLEGEATLPAADHTSDYQRLLQEWLEGYESRRRTTLLATAAHELKTPLAVIAGYIDLLLTEKLGLLNGRQRKVLLDSQLNCARLQQFVHDFLTCSSLDTGKLAMNFQLSDLNACLCDMYRIWLPQFQKKRVALYFPVNDTLEAFRFDYAKVQHVVSNLLENSLKFTPEGGTVWLSAEPHAWDRRVHQDWSVSEERRKHSGAAPIAIRVTVSDSGPGIAPEYQQEVFNEFFKVPQPDDRFGGSGLGLAIARRLVQAHRGKIWLESETGAGSKFSFLLPVRLEQGSGQRGEGR